MFHHKRFGASPAVTAPSPPYIPSQMPSISLFPLSAQLLEGVVQTFSPGLSLFSLEPITKRLASR